MYKIVHSFLFLLLVTRVHTHIYHLGWCPGKDVTPLSLDVSTSWSLSAGDSNIVTYSCLQLNYTTLEWEEPPESSTGYIILSSNIVYYSTVDDHDQTLLPLQQTKNSFVSSVFILSFLLAIVSFLAFIFALRLHSQETKQRGQVASYSQHSEHSQYPRSRESDLQTSPMQIEMNNTTKFVSRTISYQPLSTSVYESEPK